MRRPTAPRLATVCTLILAAVLASGCGGESPIPESDLALFVQADVEEVELGLAFEVRVVRVWRSDLEPEPFDEASLSPLTVRPVETTRREDDRRVMETTVFRAYAFEPGDLTVPAPELVARPRGGGAERFVRGNRLDLRVRSALDPDDPGPVELPGGLLSDAFPWLLVAGGIVTVMAGVALLRLLGRRRGGRADGAPPASPEPVRPDEPGPHVRALARLERLRETRPETEEEIEAFYVEGADVLRDYVGARFVVRTAERTTEEILAASALALGPEAALRRALSRLLGGCDRVKFARARPDAEERDGFLSRASDFVSETAEDDGATS